MLRYQMGQHRSMMRCAENFFSAEHYGKNCYWSC